MNPIDTNEFFNSLQEGESLSDSFKIVLETKLGTNKELVIYIGNSFIGFYPLIVNQAMMRSSSTNFDLIGFLTAIPVLLFFYHKKYK
jgi:hypothetical protein